MRCGRRRQCAPLAVGTADDERWGRLQPDVLWHRDLQQRDRGRSKAPQYMVSNVSVMLCGLQREQQGCARPLPAPLTPQEPRGAASNHPGGRPQTRGPRGRVLTNLLSPPGAPRSRGTRKQLVCIAAGAQQGAAPAPRVAGGCSWPIRPLLRAVYQCDEVMQMQRLARSAALGRAGSLRPRRAEPCFPGRPYRQGPIQGGLAKECLGTAELN